MAGGVGQVWAVWALRPAPRGVRLGPVDYGRAAAGLLAATAGTPAPGHYGALGHYGPAPDPRARSKDSDFACGRFCFYANQP